MKSSKYLRKVGKKGKRWANFRRKFLKKLVGWDGRVACQKCGKRLEIPEVEVDHVIKRSVRPDLVFDETNLVALCSDCHRKKHSVR